MNEQEFNDWLANATHKAMNEMLPPTIAMVNKSLSSPMTEREIVIHSAFFSVLIKNLIFEYHRKSGGQKS